MTEKEIRQWMLEEVASDKWWLSIDNKLEDEPLTLAEAADRVRDLRGYQVDLLHDSQFHTKNRPWVTFDTSSVLTPEEREAVRARRIRKMGGSTYLQLFCVLGILAVLGGFYLFRTGQEFFARDDSGENNSLNEVFAKLDQGDYSSSDYLPKLPATIAVSGRLIYVVNKSKKDWEWISLELKGNSGGYHYKISSTVAPNETIQIPIREFVKDGEIYPYQEGPPTSITIEVPGYRILEERFESVSGANAR